uniref:Secretion system C-terminal sorting domain-containing protein n=1 Tax=uncultured bacterium A1Q1_fos_97 TaxID=1256593 RepID=L7VYU9_9BACT|nr:hypothetical protein [uncultured bacterium A1Q1_fos_97]
MQIKTIIRTIAGCGLFFLAQSNLIGQCNCKETYYLIKYKENNLSKCRHILSKAELGIVNCPDSYLVVNDGKINGDTIDAPGSYSYTLYTKDGKSLCSGGVGLQPQTPVLDSTQFIQNPIPFTTSLRLPTTLNTGFLNNTASPIAYPIKLGSDGKLPTFPQDTIPNLGFPFFSYNCATVPCSLSLDLIDEYNIEPCDNGGFYDSSRYATLKRTWIARGCTEIPELVTQNIYIRRPNKEDLHWNIPFFKDKIATYYYTDPNITFEEFQIKNIFPVMGKENLLIGREGTLIRENIQEQKDTLPDGVHFSRTFLIYDNCKQQYLDTFNITLQPRPDNHLWLGAASEVTLPVSESNCKIVLSSSNVEQMLTTLGLRYNPRCKPANLSWRLVNKSLVGVYYNPFVNPNHNGDYELYSGDYLLYITSLDSCGNLDIKNIDILVRIPNQTLNIKCGTTLKVKLNSFHDGKRIEYVAGLGFNYESQACGAYSIGTRRIVESSCLSNFRFFSDYDLDGDGNVLEHFELIKSGPFARMYYSPWRHYIYALECDEGKPVYFQSFVKEAGGNADTCLGYINVLRTNTNKIQTKLSVEKGITAKNKSICLPISTSGLNNLAALQFGVKFNPEILKFDSIHLPNKGQIKALVGFPGQGTNPKDRLFLSWVFDGRNTANLLPQSQLFDLCFSPLSLGISPVWIDSLNGLEIVDINESIFQVKTSIGEVNVVEKIDYRLPINQIQNASPIDRAIISNKNIPDIKVFPNPGQDQVFISLPATWPPQGKIVLKDLQGRVLMRQEITTSTSTFNLPPQVPNGIHLLEIQSQNQVWTQRLVVFKP